MTEPVRMMRAMCASSPDPASLSSQSVPVPDPGPDEVLVEVRATAITVFDLDALPEAFRATRAGRPPGKVIIRVG